MEERIKYNLKKVEGQYKEAKIVGYNNSILSKSIEFPAIMFYVQSAEEIDAIGRYYFQQLPHNYIFGYTIPFHQLASLAPELLKKVPHDVTIMSDINTEIYWSDNFRPELRKFYQDYLAIPDKVKAKMKEIISVVKPKERIEAHKTAFREIINDKSLLMALLTSTVNRQHGYQVDILSGFSPLLLDKDHIDFVEECYAQTKKLYHSTTNNIELDGKVVGLFANLHTNFLSNKSNITEFLKMIERAEPKALIFKIFNLIDIRTKKTLQNNYELLVKGIGNISQSMQIPTFFFATHTSGYKAQTQGIDVYCEPFNHVNSIGRKPQLSSDTLKKMYEIDPQFRSGKIYDIKSGELISRKQFQQTRLTSDEIDTPVSYFAKYNPEVVRQMTDKAFREFSKNLMMESRNFEEEELHKGIKKGDLHKIQTMLSKWQGLDGLK